MSSLPRIKLGSLETSRLIAGSNPVSGFSHAGASRSEAMLNYFTVERIKGYLRDCEANGIDAVVARADAFTIRYLAEYWREGGKIKWIAQTAPEYKDPLRNIQMARDAGASAIYVHGGEVDRLMREGAIEEIRNQTERIRQLGLPVGVASHVPDHLLEMQSSGIDVDFYNVCLYDLNGYMGRRGAESEEEFRFEDRAVALAALRKLERPCIAYKILAAGRLTLAQGLADVKAALRPGDGILIGMFPPDCVNIVATNVAAVAALA